MLIIAVYSAAEESCRTGKHKEIGSALGEHDADAAARLMADCLLSIESRLEIGRRDTDGIDLWESSR